MSLSPEIIDDLGRSLQPKQLSGRAIVFAVATHLYVYRYVCMYQIIYSTSTYSYMHVYLYNIIHAQSLHIISNVEM